MSVRAKTPLIETVTIGRRKYALPKNHIAQVVSLVQRLANAKDGSVSSDDAFSDLDAKYGRSGSALRGARLKEEMTQEKLSELTGIAQADISAMEHGKSIGKVRAKRLAKVLKVDYRIFL